MSGTQKHTSHGNCHCGAFKFTVELRDLTTVTIGQCNCSICSKKGALWVKPAASEGGLNIERGEEKLTTYQFGSKNVEHKFCSICGTSVLLQVPNGPVFPNARTFREFDLRTVDLASLSLSVSDGASRDPAYVAPAYEGPQLEPGEGEKVYTGGCHCGAITLAVKTKPLPQVEVKECDCSICFRDAYILFYPTVTQVNVHVSPTRPQADAAYAFGRKFLEHHFCAVCGTSVYIRALGPPPEVVAQMSERGKAMVREKTSLMPVNLRVLDGVEWAYLNVTKEKEDKTDYTIRSD